MNEAESEATWQSSVYARTSQLAHTLTTTTITTIYEHLAASTSLLLIIYTAPASALYTDLTVVYIFISLTSRGSLQYA